MRDRGYCGLTTRGSSKLSQKKPFVSDLLSDLGREAAVEICGSEPPVQLRLGWDTLVYLSRQAEKEKSKEAAPYIKVYMVKGTKGQGWRL